MIDNISSRLLHDFYLNKDKVNAFPVASHKTTVDKIKKTANKQK